MRAYCVFVSIVIFASFVAFFSPGSAINKIIIIIDKRELGNLTKTATNVIVSFINFHHRIPFTATIERKYGTHSRVKNLCDCLFSIYFYLNIGLKYPLSVIFILRSGNVIDIRE